MKLADRERVEAIGRESFMLAALTLSRPGWPRSIPATTTCGRRYDSTSCCATAVGWSSWGGVGIGCGLGWFDRGRHEPEGFEPRKARTHRARSCTRRVSFDFPCFPGWSAAHPSTASPPSRGRSPSPRGCGVNATFSAVREIALG